jgi:hypothetical protein
MIGGALFPRELIVQVYFKVLCPNGACIIARSTIDDASRYDKEHQKNA